MTTTEITPDHGETTDPMIGKRVLVTKCSPDEPVGYTGIITKPYGPNYDGDTMYHVLMDDEARRFTSREDRTWVVDGYIEWPDEMDKFALLKSTNGSTWKALDEAEGLLRQERIRTRQLTIQKQEIVTCIGEHLMEAAEENDMCSVYDNRVARANEDLERWGVALPTRRKLVESRVRVRGEVYRDVNVMHYDDEDPSDATNWRDGDGDPLGDNYKYEQLDGEHEENGWDEVNVSILRDGR